MSPPSRKTKKTRLKAKHRNLLAKADDARKEAVAAREILNTVIERVNDGFVALDNNWCYTFVNARAARMLQRETPDDLIGKHIWTEYPEGVGQPFHQAYLQAFETQQPVIFEEYFTPWDQWYENRIYPSPNGLTIYFTEITKRKQAEETLRQSAAVFATTRDGVMITDLEARILSVNKAFTEITGYTEAEVLGQIPSLFQPGQEDRDFHQTIWINLQTADHWQGEIWNRRKNGEIYPEWLTISTVRDEQDKPIRYVGVFSDISHIKQSEAKLEHLAHYDTLTQLPNRLLLFSRLEHSIKKAQRGHKLLALLMLDLDHFKDVNDSFGHLAGDELLQQVAKRLTDRLRGNDTVCRLGGDEFTVVLDEITQPEDAARVANEIIATLSEPWLLSNGAEVRICASVGISLFPEHGATAEELLQQADTSLYQAKTEGRGRFKYFTEELTHSVRARIELEARLRRAIDQDELRVFYQPQVDLTSGHIVGAEALVHWQDPEEGLIPPTRFIQVAEATGLITSIGNWVLKEACRQGQRWIDSDLPPLSLGVNLSPHQFLHSNIAEIVAETLATTNFPSTQLELELTESALMARETDSIRILDQLRALGVRIVIDDFGTGYSSLAYLKSFPLDVLKIDKSFVDDIPYNQDDMAITATIIAMAHTLRLKVLAEGVETKEQLDFLQMHGCDIYQGYLTSRPVPAVAFEKLLAAQVEVTQALIVEKTNRKL